MEDKKAELDEDKADDEDYMLIDKKFTADYEQLENNLVSWEGQGLDKEGLEAHFEDVFKQYTALQEYVNNYAFVIPKSYFGLYCTRLN